VFEKIEDRKKYLNLGDNEEVENIITKREKKRHRRIIEYIKREESFIE